MLQVGVWVLTIPGAGADVDASVLDRAESARAASFRDPADRWRYVVAHVGLRQLLAARLGVRAADVEFARRPCPVPGCGGPHGRPVVAGQPRLEFSLSHAGGLAYYAVAGADVGVDVEAAAVAGPGVARRLGGMLHPRERAALAALPDAVRDEAFLGCWVRKEAFLKGLGTGLAGDVGAHHVGLPREFAPAVPGADAGDGPEGWAVTDVAAPAGYRAAVAVRRSGTDGEPAVRVRPFAL
ncbi:4'-phosphopantetheinyl transferase family protein [Streptomyces sp. URMC 129]|uniref:4'-phosphopantetheinyl transferase family protein n=1 Tax=Streptomyces sp. URMC 129 TaxID=3423407 RepID=UPI003F1AF155